MRVVLLLVVRQLLLGIHHALPTTTGLSPTADAAAHGLLLGELLLRVGVVLWMVLLRLLMPGWKAATSRDSGGR
jgi:hypothetical protein